MDLAVGAACGAIGAALSPGIPRVARWASGVDVRLGHPLAVGALAALVLGLVGARIGWRPELPAFTLLAAVGTVLLLVDLRLHRLPDRLTLPSYAVGVVLLTGAAAADGSWSRLGRAVAGAAVLVAVYLVLYLAVRAGLGAGDVKYAGVLGLHLAWLGWPTLVIGAFGGFVLGGLVSITLLMTGRATLRTRIAFGPPMIAGAVLAIALGAVGAAAAIGS